ncbi:uncharacterized protein LOC142239265 [Haematobia irritans]|uniref:uncharacterized protein LOC142239265 n=1 Tax=Haematobia irritans TaxID=7368 RepID=UPI003F506623
MACPKWSLLIAGVIIVVYLVSISFTLKGLFARYHYSNGSYDIFDNKSGEMTVDSYHVKYKPFTRDEIAEYTFELGVDISSLIAAVFMFVGVKKGLHKFIAPWLIISLIDVLGQVVIMFFEKASKLETNTYFALILFITAMWYPIYRQYKLIRYPKSIISANAPNTEICYTTTTAYSHQTATAPVEV